jgi:hypothetical protein
MATGGFESCLVPHFQRFCVLWKIIGSFGPSAKAVRIEKMLHAIGTIPTRISLDDLEATRRSFSQEVRDNPHRETFTLAVSIVRHFFGYQWYLDHVFQDAEGSYPEGFMRIDYTQGPVGERKTTRLQDFAENLFNLQHIVGFDDRVNQMRADSMIESTLAEFDFARFLMYSSPGWTPGSL